MFAQLADVTQPQPGCVFNPDQWDGYAVARAKVIATIADNQLDNIVILTGDIHSSWAMDVTENPFDPAGYNGTTGEGSLAVEFVTPGVTSPGIEDPAQAAYLAAVLGATHPHVKLVNLFNRGYLLLDVNHDRVQAEWYHMTTILEPSEEETLGGVFQTQSGANRVVAGGEVSMPREDAPPPAPQPAIA